MGIELKVKYLFIILVLCNVSKVFAQDPKGEMWFSISMPVHFGKQNTWQWTNDASYRTNGMSLVPHLYLYRSGIRHQLNSHWNVAAGGALLFTRVSYNKNDHEFGQENRLWQEVVHQTSQSATFRLQNRFRVEERFFDAVENRSAFHAVRFRYRSLLTYAVRKNLLMQVADEYMQQLADAHLKFNQNRLYATLIRTLAKQSQVQLSYIWQYSFAAHARNCREQDSATDFKSEI